MTIIIVGAGMAGATLALAISSLSHGKIPIALVETLSPDNTSHPGFDARTIALTQGACQQLTDLGIWPTLVDCATAITHIQVSDRGHAGLVNLSAEDYGIAALGQVVELPEMGKRLFSLLAQAPCVSLFCPAKVVEVTRTEKTARVTLDNGQQLTGKLLVAADGSGSLLGRACHIQWQQQDYQQIAVVANIMTEKKPVGWAFERFTCSGPLALLPMSQQRCSLVWCHNERDREQVGNWSDSRFLSELQQAFGWRLGKILQVGKRYSHPLHLLTASRHISHRVALVGNAAQTLHPIAAQGFNLALRDVIALSNSIVQAVQAGVDPGEYRVLSEYESGRRHDQQATIKATDGLIRLFANNDFPLVIGRNLSLLAMAQIPCMRHAFIRQTFKNAIRR
ncbi:2-octaprenyl-6-methoxyphenol hydroxylase, FAD/NAD(P)-binding [Candidatus Regiella insecticola LSR1]|uniref:2-octaprenyl-6-methoxyphenol hydroxylase, FAD/NAD(P)-binding n=1 Tax=Candidatus Regiella insecticola LSR1 TaxID=663321 RepID=E0WTM5_9ENTR|nr:2-octaprenyl-6-methoxyphenyl hydroxylase [Candidatus Regiella insecticola]EFL91910.1 2-octaprenyl-6-methoxyphenol hydroxylase, FAD/NAD(P)-binding [Candidatus Regiella insecticola LSR1]